ncbi:hypothetical protein SAMN05216455_11125 [Segatella bryantii]|nr:hypothetical protein SAMN05216455_11125 [Segatella bryantii]
MKNISYICTCMLILSNSREYITDLDVFLLCIINRNLKFNIMKYLIISLCLFFGGHLTVNSHPCYVDREECYNLEQKDSVLRERILDRFEKINIVHTNRENLTGLKQSADWEVRKYALKQKSIFKQMEYNILKQVSFQILNKVLGYKFNPIICKLIIAPHDGVVKKVSFQMSHKISSDITNKEILEFENIILNTQFIPDPSITGDILLCNWVIGREAIKKYLDSNK